MAQKQTRWRKLDNTANLFPVIPGRQASNVFRLSAVLRDEVDGVLLNEALADVLPASAVFGMRLRHGLFWNYLEQNDAPAAAVREQEAPCRAIDPLETNRYLFRVLYFGARISLETYHALTDGTGALRFLQALCYRYCQLRYAAELPAGALAARYGAEQALNVQDGYLRSYLPQKAKKTYREPRAFRLRGERRMPFDMGVCTLLMPAQRLREVCRAQGASVGEMLTAAALMAVREEYLPARGAKRPVAAFVPVDLRRGFGCDTSANFFAGVTVREHFGEAQRPFGEVLASVRVQLAEKTTREALAQKLAYTARGELNFAARLAPLPLKNGVLRLIYEGSSAGATLTVSNLGRVSVEPAFAPFIQSMRFLLSETKGEPVKCAAVTCKDIAAVTVTSQLEGQAVARNMARRLARAGVPVTVESAGEEP